MATLRFDALQKDYGETTVLRDITMDVQDGEYLVLVGPSGCGKSTLLRCIAGLEEVTSGQLFIGDRRMNEVSARDRNVAMVFQSYALYPHMTVRENLGFALRVQKQAPSMIEKAVVEVAEMLDLGTLLDRTPAQLSGGQRQRVAMGRAIVRHPDVFLFDEPLSNLDAALRGHMRVELKRLHRRLGATVVHVTHDQVEALTLADRILVLNEGVVQQLGTPRELFDRPQNIFVATFIGSPSMNLLPAKASGGVAKIEGVEGQVPVSVEGDFTLGVRPTDISLGNEGLAATIDVVESLGAEALVYLNCGSQVVVAQVTEPFQGQPGDSVFLKCNTVHCFDGENGSRL
jgi:multiple sugar transport system ATP-binding protein